MATKRKTETETGIFKSVCAPSASCKLYVGAIPHLNPVKYLHT